MISHEGHLKLKSYSIYWRGGSLIPHEDKLKFRFCSIYWPEVVVVLIPHENNFKESDEIVSESDEIVSESDEIVSESGEIVSNPTKYI